MSNDADSHKLTIDVVSDVVCPWCFVGKKRLEAALAMAPDIDVEIHWRPYQLDATIPKGGIDRKEYLTRKFGPDGATNMNGRLAGVGAEVGIPFAFDKIERSPNTLDAHRLLRWAQMAGTQDAVKEQLFQLYFVEGKDIGDHKVLADVAAQNGLERAVVERLLAGPADEDEVKSEIETAQKIGVTGVPFFIFNSRLGVSGAQSPEVLVSAMRQAMQEKEAVGGQD
ncbi:DsbA family oxidoreductase [Roseiarcaceae bacterium H3SJ34-1]|uniref:DsbA family oxidoreductase n=1 Tax=Terripilifer ovatus TaxID=3032367 RepID=UPI003AB993DE|nr:DsbA family oxidoreductase [Roseiarcaceae bacterium H3SJ34-1]